MSILVLTSDTLIGTPATGNVEYNGQFYGTDSNASRAQIQRITQGTAVASTSGTSIDFTSLPAWVKRITVMFAGVSTNSSSPYLLQIGSGSITTTGYVSSAANLDPTSSIAASGSTAGIKLCNTGGATVIFGGSVVLNLLSPNTWVASGILARSDNAGSQFLNSGYVSLGGTLDRVRITTISGTDTFDAGTINILYEG